MLRVQAIYLTRNPQVLENITNTITERSVAVLVPKSPLSLIAKHESLFHPRI
jgi:hypothetical protein